MSTRPASVATTPATRFPPQRLPTGGGAAMNNYSQKSDSFPTNCANIIDLCSSPHNTLMATGLAASTASANNIKTAKDSKKKQQLLIMDQNRDFFH
jgi:hypothetical protein